MKSCARLFRMIALLAIGFCIGDPIAECYEQKLLVIPLYAWTGASVTVSWSSPGSDGCYRQSDATTTVTGFIIQHVYRTWSEGASCTEAIVHGGFWAGIVPARTGDYSGAILTNGKRVATYRLRVFPDEDAAINGLLQDLPHLGEQEFCSAVIQIMKAEKRKSDLDQALAVIAPAFLEEPHTPAFNAVIQWLKETADAAVIKQLEPAIRNIPETLDDMKWPVLERIGIYKPRPEETFSDLDAEVVCPEGADKAGSLSGALYEVACLQPGSGRRTGPYLAWHVATKKPALTGQWIDGWRDGLWTEHNTKGEKILEVRYETGRMEGVATEWAGGKIFARKTYHRGSLAGPLVRYDANGNPSTSTWYENDQRNGEFLCYRPDGSVWLRGGYRNDAQHGQWFHYRRDGNPETLETWADGKKDGIEIVWNTQGEKETWRTYADGRLHGPAHERSCEGEYANGVKTGLWKCYDADGGVRENGYLDGQLHGDQRERYPGGRLRIVETFDHGLREGLREWCCADGRRIGQWRYAHGRLVQERIHHPLYPYVWYFDGADEHPTGTKPFWGYFLHSRGRPWLWLAATLAVTLGIGFCRSGVSPAKAAAYRFFFLPAGWALACAGSAVFIMQAVSPTVSFSRMGFIPGAAWIAPFAPYTILLIVFAAQKALHARFPFPEWSVKRFLCTWLAGIVLLAGIWSFILSVSGASKGPLRGPRANLCDVGWNAPRP